MSFGQEGWAVFVCQSMSIGKVSCAIGTLGGGVSGVRQRLVWWSKVQSTHVSVVVLHLDAK